MGIVLPLLNTLAQSPPVFIRPLTIGDTVPDVVIGNLLHSPVATIHLSALKGKWVILDFWERGCSNCIKALPKLQQIADSLREQVQVITITRYGNRAQLSAALKGNKLTQGITLPVAIQDSTTQRYFPFEIISHVVWIDPEGIVRAITGSDYISLANARTLLRDKIVSWPVKADAVAFDYTQPLFHEPRQVIRPAAIPACYTALTGYLPGIEALDKQVVDSGSGRVLINKFNKTLLDLCSVAITGNLSGQVYPKHLLLQVADRGKYLPDPLRDTYAEWAERNTYCYSFTSPLSMSAEDRRAYYRQDLQQRLHALFGITVERKKTPVATWVLIRSTTEKGQPLPANTGSAITLQELLWRLNEATPGIPWVADETRLSPWRTLAPGMAENTLTDLPTLRRALRPYGLDIIEAQREREMFIITEKTSYPVTPLHSFTH